MLAWTTWRMGRGFRVIGLAGAMFGTATAPKAGAAAQQRSCSSGPRWTGGREAKGKRTRVLGGTAGAVVLAGADAGALGVC